MDEKMRLLWKPTKLTCDIIIPDLEKSHGVQKVIGFSRGWHHYNSIRLGIRKEDTYIVLYFYAYIDGKRIIQRLGRFEIGEIVSVDLQWGYYIECRANDKYAFRIAPKRSFPIGYRLYPFAEKDGVRGVEVPIEIEISNLRISGRSEQVCCPRCKSVNWDGSGLTLNCNDCDCQWQQTCH